MCNSDKPLYNCVRDAPLDIMGVGALAFFTHCTFFSRALAKIFFPQQYLDKIYSMYGLYDHTAAEYNNILSDFEIDTQNLA